ncbi:hypothetical protein GBAR_LOCUS4012 [Geodia barretti]|jgi:hypothetical protein|uniref:Uncharacterized protein n=2 Tax=Geodia barretti TaxID=519541 RepID=A0AA35R594_GEOBA|nr:hypothetical protein GBAR_LOCUS4012 [Geodia barretti]
MIAIRRLAKRFSKQTLSEVKPAPLSETVDHTVEEEAGEPPLKAFQNPSTPLSPYPSLTLSSPASSDEDDDSEDEDDKNNRMERRVVYVRRRQRVAPSRGDLPVERVPSAEKRKYSQYKCSVECSSSASSSDDEVKEAFESSDHTSWSQRPIRVPPSGCRKRVSKYFAQMASTGSIERPQLDFKKMQSKRFLMVHKPVVVLRHNYHPCTFSGMCPPLELSLDFTSHSFQPVPTQT